MKLSTVALIVLPPITLVASCALSGFVRGESTLAAGGGGGSAGAGGALGGGGAGGNTSCAHASFPPPPAAPPPGGTDEMVVAMRRIRLTADANGGALGVDLDRLCTCGLEGPSCVSTEQSQQYQWYCDGPDGRDDGMQPLFIALGVVMGGVDLSQFYSQAAEQGRWSLLIRMRNYNGGPDDGQVEVALFASTGYPVPGPAPSWQGQDAWPISSTSLDPGGGGAGGGAEQPRYVDHDAYVTDGWLVAKLPSAEVVLAGTLSHFAIKLTGGGLMARITSTANGYSLSDGLLAARIGIADLFAALSSFRDDAGKPLCTSDMFYGTAKAAFCNAPDILMSLGSPAGPCDAVSAALGFDADPAAIGAIKTPTPPSQSCAPGSDPAGDDCSGF